MRLLKYIIIIACFTLSSILSPISILAENIVVGHRGSTEKALPNTRMSFLIAGTNVNDIDALECDVFETHKDIIGCYDFVIYHDLDEFNKVYKHEGSIKDLTADELSKMGACMLSDYLNICKQCNKIPVIELKSKNLRENKSDYIEAIVTKVFLFGLEDKVIWSSFGSGKGLDKINKTYKKYNASPPKTYLLAIGKKGIRKAKKSAEKYKLTGVGFNKKHLNYAKSKLSNSNLSTAVWGFSGLNDINKEKYKSIQLFITDC